MTATTVLKFTTLKQRSNESEQNFQKRKLVEAYKETEGDLTYKHEQYCDSKYIMIYCGTSKGWKLVTSFLSKEEAEKVLRKAKITIYGLYVHTEE